MSPVKIQDRKCGTKYYGRKMQQLKMRNRKMGVYTNVRDMFTLFLKKISRQLWSRNVLQIRGGRNALVLSTQKNDTDSVASGDHCRHTSSKTWRRGVSSSCHLLTTAHYIEFQTLAAFLGGPAFSDYCDMLFADIVSKLVNLTFTQGPLLSN